MSPTEFSRPYRRRIDPPSTQIERGFGSARVPGRLDRRGRWLFDVAHNPDGMRSLVAALSATGPSRPLHALVSILGDKEWPEMLVQLDQAIDRGVLTIAPTAAAAGGISNGSTAGWLTRRVLRRMRMAPDPRFQGGDRDGTGGSRTCW